MKAQQNLELNIKLLRQNQLKATPARLAIFDLFNNSTSPLSIKDVSVILRKEKIDLVTMYRIINVLVKKGLLRQVEMQHNHAHYELAKNHHHHLVCQSCNKTVDIQTCNFKSIKKQALELSGFAEIKEHSFELFGMCKQCAKKKQKKTS